MTDGRTFIIYLFELCHGDPDFSEEAKNSGIKPDNHRLLSIIPSESEEHDKNLNEISPQTTTLRGGPQGNCLTSTWALIMLIDDHHIFCQQIDF